MPKDVLREEMLQGQSDVKSWVVLIIAFPQDPPNENLTVAFLLSALVIFKSWKSFLSSQA